MESDEVGAEAETPALVMDSAAPSNVKITGAPEKVVPVAMRKKKKSPFERAVNAANNAAMRPETGSEVSNAVVDVVAEVQEEKPDIMKTGEEAIIPSAEKPLEGFAPNEETAGDN